MARSEAQQVFCIAADEHRDELSRTLQSAGFAVTLSTARTAPANLTKLLREALDTETIVFDIDSSQSSQYCAATAARLARRSPLGRVLAVAANTAQISETLSELAKLKSSAPVDFCLREELAAQAATRIRLLELRAERAHVRDELTGLGNRPALREHLAAVLGQVPTAGATAMFIMDIDHFKSVNDVHGHAAGDALLSHIGDIIMSFGTAGVRGFRIGGDEIGGIVNAVDRDELALTLDQLRSVISESCLKTESGEIRVTVSIGYTLLSNGMDIEEVFRQADQAQYDAKVEGRNRVQCFDIYWEQANADPNQAAFDHFENVTRVWGQRFSDLIIAVGKRALEESRRTADRDGLTELFNRRYFDRRMARELEHTSRDESSLSVVLLDIDDFHDVNMRNGYPTGDRALKAVADLISNHSRTTDWVARYGGEEFCVVMPSTPVDDATVVAERIRAAVEAATIAGYDERTLNVTISLGVASSSEVAPDELTTDAIIQIASDRVIAAKRNGKNRVVTQSPPTQAAAR